VSNFCFSAAPFDAANQIPGALAVPLTQSRMIPAAAREIANKKLQLLHLTEKAQ
jgi:DNA-binding IclR family transcriptional regulator